MTTDLVEGGRQRELGGDYRSGQCQGDYTMMHCRGSTEGEAISAGGGGGGLPVFQ